MGIETALLVASTAATAAAANQQRKSAKEATQMARDAQGQQIDPRELIELQARYNRVGARNPFGSATYQQNAGGGFDVVTEFSPQMQALANRQMGLAMTDSNRYQLPQQFGGLQDQLFGRIGQQLGQQGGPPSGRGWASGLVNSPAPPMSWGQRPQGGSAKPPNQGAFPPMMSGPRG